MSDVPVQLNEAIPNSNESPADGSVTEASVDNSAAQIGTKLDGSTIDLTVSEDGTCTSTPTKTSQSMTEKYATSSCAEESSVSGIETEMETAELTGEVDEEQAMENPILEEPLTPATDNSATKSLPGSGRVTPASQSDQSLTFSSSEKSTPSRKVKMSDISGRQIEFDSLSSSSGSVKNVQFPHRVGISWRKGEKLEAMDYLDSWFPAKIRAINEEDMQVLIHFDGWNQRFDEWIDMASERIRPLIRHSERKGKRKSKEHARGDPCLPFTSPDLPCKRTIKEHKVGDAVYAKWTDCKMYPAKITSVMANGSYEVIFYDGFKKVVQPINIRSMPGDYKQKTFEINPVPEVVLKKAKMKLDSADMEVHPEERSRSKSVEMVKPEPLRDSSAEKERKSRSKKKKHKASVLFSEQSDVCSSTEVNMLDLTSVKSEPVSTQTEYAEGKVQTECSDNQIPVTSPSMLASPAQVPVQGTPVIPPKAFVVESDHYHFKCPFDGCGKGFRKEQLLDYHIKYYHINDGGPPPPPAKRRRKTTSTCSTEADPGSSSRKYAGKKNRNLSAECSIEQPDVKFELPEVRSVTYSETGEISTQTSPSKHSDFFESEDVMRPEFKIQDSMDESSVTDAEDFLKPDELVNCICDFQEENGLMIQCEVCMCWQHAACFGITERTLPKTYVCFVCENPPGVRESSRHIHEQDWFKTGEIASFSYLPLTPMSEDRCNTVKSTHTLVAEIHQLNSVLHSLKLQLKILRTKDESKLKQWRLDWDVMESDTVESCPNTDAIAVHNTTAQDSDNTSMQTESIGANHIKVKVENPEVKVEIPEIKTEITEDSGEKSVATIDPAEVKSENADMEVGSKDNKTEKVELKAEDVEIKMEVAENSEDEKIGKEIDLTITNEMNGVQHAKPGSCSSMDSKPPAEIGPVDIVDTLKANETVIKLENPNEVKQEPVEKVEEGNHSDSTESVVEDPIEVCEKNLLSHILRVQGEISDRFDRIEEHIEMLEAMEAVQSRREPPTASNVLNDTPQIKRSMRYMLSDLSKVKKMSVFH